MEIGSTYLDVYDHAHFKIINASHMAFYDKPKEFGDIVSEFFVKYNINE